MARRRLALALRAGLFAALLGGCDADHRALYDNTSPAPYVLPPQPTASNLSDWHGRLAGKVDGVLTANGLLRLTVLDPETQAPTQLAGRVEFDGSEARGTGLLVGQDCVKANVGRFCDEPAPFAIHMTATRPFGREFRIAADVRVTTATATETWAFEMGHWGGAPPGWAYAQDFSQGGLAGMYRSAAPFVDDETVVTVDEAGRVFFQSAVTGCVGNGTARTRPTFRGVEFVYDFDLTLAGCGADRAAWNGALSGLATFEPPTPWEGEDFGIRFWLSAPDGAPRAVAGHWPEL